MIQIVFLRAAVGATARRRDNRGEFKETIMTLLTIDDPSPAPLEGAGLWRLGFRPFYLLAAALAALAVPLWMAAYYGVLRLPAVGLLWHLHEMVFGMAVAVVVGFLYTAGRNWTNLWTPRGTPLALLAALWLAGRVAMLVDTGPWAALVDSLFLPLAAWPLWRVMRQAGNKRNYFLVVLLVLLATANLAHHAAALGWAAWSPLLPARGAIFVIVLMEAVIGVRVLPMFTRNGAPGSAPAVKPTLDKAGLLATVAAGIAWIGGAPAWLTAPLCAAAGVLTLWRLAGWQPQRTLKVPLLWVLHLSYAWIGVGFLLLAMAALGRTPASAACHALTVGSMAGLIIGMMCRTSLGHTGRPLKAGSAEVSMFVAIQLAAVARLTAALDTGGLRDGAMLLAATAWTVAFALFVIAYAGRLARPRIDGKEG
jgi:uncharacterized protein involved in response to NO